MSASPAPTLIEGGAVLTGDGGLEPGSLVVDGGRITALGAAGAFRSDAAHVLHAAGLLVLPGIVDVHGDAFERQVMPRPGRFFPQEMALTDTDRQLTASGVTTAFHGLTVSWEPGLRSADSGKRFVAALDAMAPHVGCDTHLHIRWETFALDWVDLVIDWLDRPARPVVAVNDHTPSMYRKRSDPTRFRTEAARSGLTEEAFVRRVEAEYERAGEVPAAVERLLGAARARGVPIFSHDDETPDMRAWYRSHGATVAEFPRSIEATRAARAAGDEVVLGAPNVVCGGSHTGAIGAVEAILDELCTVLASDYHYPSLLHSAFILTRGHGLPLAEAWKLISSRAASAAGLADRGTLAEGMRADIVLVDAPADGLPSVVATIAGGRLVHLAEDRLIRRPRAAAVPTGAPVLAGS